MRITTLNLLDQKVRNAQTSLDIGRDFPNKIPVAQKIRLTINKWHFMKIKCFCTSETSVNGMTMEWNVKEMVRIQKGRKYLPPRHMMED